MLTVTADCCLARVKMKRQKRGRIKDLHANLDEGMKHLPIQCIPVPVSEEERRSSCFLHSIARRDQSSTYGGVKVEVTAVNALTLSRQSRQLAAERGATGGGCATDSHGDVG